MSIPIVSNLPFTDRLDMRENALAWISRDVGIQHFLIPEHLSQTWTPEQKHVWTTTVINRFVNAQNTTAGNELRTRVMSREIAGKLRRACIKLQHNTCTHRELTRMAILLEILWKHISPTFDDNVWANCSIMFDSALMSLRVAYVWTYDRLESEDANMEARKLVFSTVVDLFFNKNAPTDHQDNKHSSNFTTLQQVWRAELESYIPGDDFNAKMDRLSDTHSLLKVAAAVSRFLNALNIDESWMWRMKQLHDDMEEGNLKRMRKPKKPVPKRTQEPPEPESSDTYEPRAPDSDFDIDIAEEVANFRKKFEYEEEEESVEESEDLMRGSMSQRTPNGIPVRRSIRVAKTSVERPNPARKGKKEKQRRGAVRRAALRFSQSPSSSGSEQPRRSRGRDRKANTRTGRIAKPSYVDVPEDMSDDDVQIGLRIEGRRRSSTKRVQGRVRALRSRLTRERGYVEEYDNHDDELMAHADAGDRKYEQEVHNREVHNRVTRSDKLEVNANRKRRLAAILGGQYN